MVRLVYEMYLIIQNFLENILTYSWMGSNSKLALIGGIMINCEGENSDLFMPLMFEICDASKQRKILFNDCFISSGKNGSNSTPL